MTLEKQGQRIGRPGRGLRAVDPESGSCTEPPRRPGNPRQLDGPGAFGGERSRSVISSGAVGQSSDHLLGAAWSQVRPIALGKSKAIIRLWGSVSSSASPVSSAMRAVFGSAPMWLRSAAIGSRSLVTTSGSMSSSSLRSMEMIRSISALARMRSSSVTVCPSLAGNATGSRSHNRQCADTAAP